MRGATAADRLANMRRRAFEQRETVLAWAARTCHQMP